MARTSRPPADPTRRAAFASGVFYLITFASSIPAALMLAPILTDAAYIVGPGEADTQILVACLLDLTNALTGIGSAVAVYSVMRRFHGSLALGFVTTRLLEAAIIVPGVCALLAAISIRQAGAAAGTDDSALVAVGQGLVGFRDATFLLGPALIPGFNALLFATILYRARLVPRWIPALGLIGGPMLISSVMGMVLGLHQLGSAYSGIATAPIFVWELSVGLYMTFKGFRREATAGMAGSAGAADDAHGLGHADAPSRAASAPVPSPVPSSSASFVARVTGFRPRRRHVFVVAGLWLAVVGNAEASAQGIGIPAVIGFSLIPTLPLLLGLGQPKRPGRVASRVVRPFNLTHEPLVPIALGALGVLGLLPVVAVVGAMVWLGSVVISWGLGDGLREADGSVRAGLAGVTLLAGGGGLARTAAPA